MTVNRVIICSNSTLNTLQFWIEPLISSDIIPDDRREFFVQEVFWNIRDIYNVNVELCDALLERQSESHVVERISDILLQHVGNFEPFVVYGSHQMVAKHMFELEKTRNPKFAEFVHVSLISPIALIFFPYPLN